MYDERMTSQSYWNEPYKNRKALKYGVFRRILEIGCAPRRWLVYFHWELGYEVHGVDYSQAGCKLTEDTLKKNGIREKMICEDVFSMLFLNKYEGFFDVVYSLGLIKHFVDPTDIIGIHLKLLRKDGSLFLGMPSYDNGTIMRLCEKIMGEKRI